MGEPGKGSPALQASNYSAPQLSTPPHTRQALGSLSSCLYATRNRGDLGSFHTFFYTFLSAVSHSEASDLLAVTARCRVQGSPGPCLTSVPNVREPSTQQSHNFTWVDTDRVSPLSSTMQSGRQKCTRIGKAGWQKAAVPCLGVPECQPQQSSTRSGRHNRTPL